MNQNTGKPAFPFGVQVLHYDRFNGVTHTEQPNEPGMTLRDYFAAKAMQGVIAGCSARHEVVSYTDVAGLAYEMADAMLKAREA